MAFNTLWANDYKREAIYLWVIWLDGGFVAIKEKNGSILDTTDEIKKINKNALILPFDDIDKRRRFLFGTFKYTSEKIQEETHNYMIEILKKRQQKNEKTSHTHNQLVPEIPLPWSLVVGA